MSQIGLHYGITHDHLLDQIHKQGFKVKSPADARKHERYRLEIHSLAFAGVITYSESEKAFKRLHKMVIKNVLERES